MNGISPSAAEFRGILDAAINSIESKRQRHFIESKLIEPYEVQLLWEYGTNEPSMAWVFADMGERQVVAQYCRGGHGALGSPWGINFRGDEHFGQDSGWYRNLGDLVADWGVDE